MTSDELTKSLIRYLRENTTSQPYSDGHIVDLPFSYLDGDSIRLYVEEHESGYRVTDRGDAIINLNEIGLNEKSAALSAHISALRQMSGSDHIGSEDYELSKVCETTDLGNALLEIGLAALRVDQLRMQAKTAHAERFITKVEHKLRDAFAHDSAVRLHASMPQTGTTNRERRVTASVTRGEKTAYIQGVSARNKVTTVSKAYRAFGQSAVPRNLRFSALEHSKNDWPDEDLHDLQEVSVVAFLSTKDELIERIDHALAA